jgi:hypothetical protein
MGTLDPDAVNMRSPLVEMSQKVIPAEIAKSLENILKQTAQRTSLSIPMEQSEE